MVDKTDYENLIAPEHQGQPNFEATIDLSVQPFVDEQTAVNLFTVEFDLDTAVGVQLDAVGVRVGRSRFVTVPLGTLYFSWDIAGLGWEQGYWQGEFDPTTGVVSLNDMTYRALLRAIIVANKWDGTLQGAVPAFEDFFNSDDAPGTLVFIVDNFDMSMTVGLAGVIPPLILQGVLTSGEINVKPVGVRVDYVVTSVGGDPIFGLDSENTFIAGLDVGAWATNLGSL